MNKLNRFNLTGLRLAPLAALTAKRNELPKKGRDRP